VAHPERIPYHAAWRLIHSYGRSAAYPATSTAMRTSHLQHPEQITVPVVLAFGDRDRLIRPVEISAPGFRSVVLADCGHIPMWDDTPRVTQLILDLSADTAAVPAA
jgi:pimeloyl-ACP methyl ester carboxylesterase